MFNSIHTSAENKNVVTDLTRKLALGPENVIARIALAYSLSKKKKLSLSEIKDSKGKEYNKSVLFGDNYSMYVGLICQHYNIDKYNKDIPKYIKMHIDDGLEMMNNETRKNMNETGLEYILHIIENGMKYF